MHMHTHAAQATQRLQKLLDTRQPQRLQSDHDSDPPVHTVDAPVHTADTGATMRTLSTSASTSALDPGPWPCPPSTPFAVIDPIASTARVATSAAGSAAKSAAGHVATSAADSAVKSAAGPIPVDSAAKSAADSAAKSAAGPIPVSSIAPGQHEVAPTSVTTPKPDPNPGL